MKRTLITAALCLLAPLHVFATARGVSPSGTNTGDCSVLSCRTVNYGISEMVGGDTLSIADGTYSEGLTYNAVPDGLDDAHHTIVQAINVGAVTLNGQESNGFVAAISGAYKTFSGLVLDAVSTTGHVGLYLWATAPVPAHHILFVDVEVKNAVGGTAGCITAGGNGDEVHDVTFRRISSHHCVMGTPTSHCFYAHMRAITVEDSLFYDCAGYGIQQYTGLAGIGLDNNTYQRNTIFNTGQDGTTYGGMYLASGDNDRVINNVIRNSGGPGSGLQISATTNLLLYNNTITGFRPAPGISGFIRESASGVDIGAIAKNNIGWDNGSTNTVFGSGITNSNNTCGSGCASSSDPLFVNAGADDLHLGLGSPAIGAGVNLCGTFCTDLTGTPRAPVAAWDQGAYAYASTTLTIPPALTTLGAGAN